MSFVPGLGIVKGMASTLRRFFEPKATIKYPEQTPDQPPKFRGRLQLLYDEWGTLKCETCFQCAQACPIECIDMGGVDTRNRFHVHWGPAEQYAERQRDQVEPDQCDQDEAEQGDMGGDEKDEALLDVGDDPPTLARHLALGPAGVLGLRVTGLEHNLINVLLLLGMPVSVVGLIALPWQGRGTRGLDAAYFVVVGQALLLGPAGGLLHPSQSQQ